VGIRLGAALLARAAPSLNLAALVLWDPVRDGAAYLDELAAAHEAYLGGWRRLFRPPAPTEGVTELMGLAVPDSELAVLRALRLTAPEGSAEPAILDSASLGLSPGWTDPRRVGEIMPDQGVSAALARLALGER
jgi:hypothetical protein